MTDETRTSRPSRRRFLASGVAASTGAVVGRSPTGSAASNADDSRAAADGSARSAAVSGRMFPYQTTPGGRISVVESGLEWRPGRVDDSDRTHVVAYDRARSMRAFLFAPEEAALDAERSFRIVANRRAVPSTGRRLVGVTLRPDG